MSCADIFFSLAALAAFVGFLFLVAMIVAKAFFEYVVDESNDQDEQ